MNYISWQSGSDKGRERERETKRKRDDRNGMQNWGKWKYRKQQKTRREKEKIGNAENFACSCVGWLIIEIGANLIAWHHKFLGRRLFCWRPPEWIIARHSPKGTFLTAVASQTPDQFRKAGEGERKTFRGWFNSIWDAIRKKNEDWPCQMGGWLIRYGGIYGELRLPLEVLYLSKERKIL